MDDAGEKKAVLIELKKHGDFWADRYGAILSHERKDEPRESFDAVQKRLRRKDKLNRND